MKRFTSFIGINGFFAGMLYLATFGGNVGAERFIVGFCVLFGICAICCFLSEEVITKIVNETPYHKGYSISSQLFNYAFIGTLFWFGFWVSAFFYFWLISFNAHIHSERKRLS